MRGYLTSLANIRHALVAIVNRYGVSFPGEFDGLLEEYDNEAYRLTIGQAESYVTVIGDIFEGRVDVRITRNTVTIGGYIVDIEYHCTDCSPSSIDRYTYAGPCVCDRCGTVVNRFHEVTLLTPIPTVLNF